MAATLQQSIDRLADDFSSLDEALLTISQSLETEFSLSSTLPPKSRANPVRLLARLRRMRALAPKLEEDAARVLAEKHELASLAEASLPVTRKRIENSARAAHVAAVQGGYITETAAAAEAAAAAAADEEGAEAADDHGANAENAAAAPSSKVCAAVAESWTDKVSGDGAAVRAFDGAMAKWKDQVNGATGGKGVGGASAAAGKGGNKISSDDLNAQVFRSGFEAMGAAAVVDKVSVQSDAAMRGSGKGSGAGKGEDGQEAGEEEEEEEEEDKGPCITPAQFKSVSTLVRGRAKIEAVNQVYAVITAHFDSLPRKEWKPLNTKALTKLGAKVTGQTGGACLNTLRSLKLIQMNREGVLPVPQE